MFNGLSAFLVFTWRRVLQCWSAQMGLAGGVPEYYCKRSGEGRQGAKREFRL
jgi:hypothetical protein